MPQQKVQCSYGCKNGRYFDTVTRSMVVCPECSARRTAEVRSGTTEGGLSISEVLGFHTEYTSSVLNVDALITPSQVSLLRPESITRVKDAAKKVYSGLVFGVAPDESICFGLDRGLRADSLAIPFLLSAYKAGLTVAPLISAPDYRAKMFREEIESRENAGVSVMRERYLNQDVVLMLIPSGIGEADILEAKGLMQARAAKGKSTMFVTSRPREFMSEVVRLASDPKSLYYARGEFVSYASSDAEGISRIQMVAQRASAGGASVTMDDLRNT